MFFKTTSTQGEASGVRFINGTVSFRSIQLNVYCFETDGVLIDTGSKSLLNEFKPFFEMANIEQVLITHAHEDHTGGASFLQDEYKLPIFMNEMSTKECSKNAAYPLYRKLFWGRRSPFEAKPIGDTFASRSANWKVIESPGHADDHLVFLNEETGQLFSGDLFVQPKTKLVLRNESVPTIIRSIEKVLAHDFEEMFCCHAGYMKDGRKALLSKLDYLKELQEQTLALYKSGKSEKEIQALLFPKKYPISFFSNGEWDSIHIIRSIVSYEKQ